MQTNLYKNIENDQWPIVYTKKYNVYFLGLEKLHPFDAKKWGNIFKYLNEYGLVNKETVTVPNEARKKDLLLVHTEKYLKSLKNSCRVACIAEVVPLILVPNYFVQKAYLKPMRYQTGGSILAGKLAIDRGWSINLGGGFHHCSAAKGGGFCAYADITLTVKHLSLYFPQVKKIMIVDLDAHQGNGYERDFKLNDHVYIMDVYNKFVYPKDKVAKDSIRKKVELALFVEDDEYLIKVKKNIIEALDEFHPNLVIYNAGTDILKGDPLGGLSVSPEGIISRDEIVFSIVRNRNIPIVMLTSGGYQKCTAKIIADSIINLYSKGLITGPNESCTK
ncbi:unnamed protein product [Brassicogethes aeneus]|uniref:Histone deacetylase 11 n=1 Tax=Brassicogethes aeneus TaxID=1431903 RepID=A0A9P0BBJ9_BRAAE|nr:unnamed protein product [Brassicogethes aeneus]